ncbi:MAG: hypothetical protein N2423_05345, partial [Novosphingobium sp.]|nr:hypothetical protein [Novosphingobium sp.]
MPSNEPIPGQLLLDHAVLEDPDAFYLRLVEEAPVWRVGTSNVFTANSHAAVTEACARVEDFSSRLVYLLHRNDEGLPGRLPHRLGDGEDTQVLATADPPHHAAHKKLISAEFSPKRIAALEDQITDMTRDRLVSGLASGRIEFMGELGNPIPIDIVTEIIGFDERNTQALFNAAIIQTDILAAAISREELERRLGISSETFGWVFMKLQQALQAPGVGILGHLARAINAGEIGTQTAM